MIFQDTCRGGISATIITREMESISQLLDVRQFKCVSLVDIITMLNLCSQLIIQPDWFLGHCKARKDSLNRENNKHMSMQNWTSQTPIIIKWTADHLLLIIPLCQRWKTCMFFRFPSPNNIQECNFRFVLIFLYMTSKIDQLWKALNNGVIIGLLNVPFIKVLPLRGWKI